MKVPISAHKLFHVIRDGHNLPQDVLNAEIPDFTPYDEGAVLVNTANAFDGTLINSFHKKMADIHMENERFEFLHTVGLALYYYITKGTFEGSDAYITLASHLMEDHDVPTYKVLPEMFAFVWAHNSGDHVRVVHPDLIMDDKEWYNAMIVTCAESVLAGDISVVKAMADNIAKAAGCGAVRMHATMTDNDIPDFIKWLQESLKDM